MVQWLDVVISLNSRFETHEKAEKSASSMFSIWACNGADRREEKKEIELRIDAKTEDEDRDTSLNQYHKNENIGKTNENATSANINGKWRSHVDLIIMIIKFIDYLSCFVRTDLNISRQFLRRGEKFLLRTFQSAFHLVRFLSGLVMAFAVMSFRLGGGRGSGNFISLLKIMSVLVFSFSMILYHSLLCHPSFNNTHTQCVCVLLPPRLMQ